MHRCRVSKHRGSALATLVLLTILVAPVATTANLSSQSLDSNSTSGSGALSRTIIAPESSGGSSSWTLDPSSSSSGNNSSGTTQSNWNWIPACIAGMVLVAGIFFAMRLNKRHQQQRQASVSSLPVARRVSSTHEPPDNYVRFDCTLQVIAEPEGQHGAQEHPLNGGLSRGLQSVDEDRDENDGSKSNSEVHQVAL